MKLRRTKKYTILWDHPVYSVWTITLWNWTAAWWSD